VYTDQEGLAYFPPGMTNGLPHKVNHVFRFRPSAICEDRENNIWICTPDGLFRISTEPLLFRPEQDLLPGRELRNLYAIPGGQLLLSRSGKGFSLFNTNLHGTEKPIGGSNTDRDFADRFAIGPGNTVWIATRRNRLYRLDGTRLSELTHLMPSDNRYFTVGLAFDRHTGTLFLCTDSTLLALRDNKMSVVIPRNTGRPVIQPLSIHFTRSGERFFYTGGTRIFELTEKDTWQEAKMDLILPANLLHSRMAEDAEGRLWIATAGVGLYLFKRMPGGQWRKIGQLTKQEGLSDNFLHSITLDAYGHCWVITSAGIDVVRASGTGSLSVARHLNSSNGIPCSDWSFGNLAADAAGRVWFAYPGGLVHFDSSILRSPPPLPAIVIESVLVNNQSPDWSARSDSLAGYRLLPVNPRFRPQENNIQIRYQGIRFRDPVVLEYSYRLNPADSQWNNAMQGNIISLLNLAPGEYRFQVRARERGGSWSNPAEFAFSIAAPWYLTTGFRALALLAIALLLTTVYRLRIRQVRKKESLLRTMKELEMTALKAQMNPHFIFNAMNSIQALVADKRPDEAIRYIGTFSRLLRQVMEQSDEQTIPLSRELDTVGLYVELESLRLNHELHYSCQYPEDLVPEYERIPPLILQPLVENAIWHGLSNKKGHKEISLDIRTENDWLLFTVEDNGVGRQSSPERQSLIAKEHSGRGLSITRQRLQAFNPDTETPMLEIFDLFRDDGTPGGTRVIVRVSRHESGGQGTGQSVYKG
jgi:ligand-binding sensor domain-containing protein